MHVHGYMYKITNKQTNNTHTLKQILWQTVKSCQRDKHSSRLGSKSSNMTFIICKKENKKENQKEVK